MNGFEDQIVALQSHLLKFARLQLLRPTWVEVAVSKTARAGLARPQTFGNRSQLKTWFVGILNV